MSGIVKQCQICRKCRKFVVKIPNLTYKSGEQMEQLGKYGFLRRDYLKNLKKKLTTLQAQDAEIRTYEEKIHHIAD